MSPYQFSWKSKLKKLPFFYLEKNVTCTCSNEKRYVFDT